MQRYLLIQLTKVDGENEYTEKILTVVEDSGSDESTKFQEDRATANKIASIFLTPNSAGQEGKRWMFEDDNREVYVEDVKPVTEADYQVLSRYLSSY